MSNILLNLHPLNTRIENVVATATLSHRLDLNVVIRILGSGRYNPDQFPGIIYHQLKPKAAMLIFGSGKIVCAGTKSERQARRILLKFIDDIRMNGVVIRGQPKIEVQNIVASADLEGSLDLEEVAYTLERTVYDPAQFPALIYRQNDSSITFLIFAQGKVVCAGAKNEADIRQGFRRLEQILSRNGLLLKEGHNFFSN